MLVVKVTSGFRSWTGRSKHATVALREIYRGGGGARNGFATRLVVRHPSTVAHSTRLSSAYRTHGCRFADLDANFCCASLQVSALHGMTAAALLKFLQTDCTNAEALEHVHNLCAHAGKSLRIPGFAHAEVADRVLRNQRALERVQETLTNRRSAARKWGEAPAWSSSLLSFDDRLQLVSVHGDIAALR